MLAAYFESFSDSVEFCGWPSESIHESATRNVEKYFSGTKGEPLSASVIALAPGCPDIVGVALFVDRPEKGAYLDLLYVRTDFQRLFAVRASRFRKFSDILTSQSLDKSDRIVQR